MKNRFDSKLGIGEGANSDFEATFEGTAVATDMKVDIGNRRGHRYSIKPKVQSTKSKVKTLPAYGHLPLTGEAQKVE